MANIKIVGGFMLDDALIEKIMELEHQVLNLEAYAEHTHAAFREVSEERDRLTVEVERLRTWIREHGTHETYCVTKALSRDQPCICGYDAALDGGRE